MAIKKAKVNHYNGESYETLHYETQASQVKVMDDNGSVYGELEEMLYKGKVVEGKSLNTLILTGNYRIKNCTNAPTGISKTKELLLIVNSVENGSERIIKQELVDFDTKSTYMRVIENGKFGLWSSAGEVIANQLKDIDGKVGILSNLKTNHKTNLVGSLNEVLDGVKDNSKGISTNVDNISDLKKKFDSHDHDNQYLKLTGGSVDGHVSLSNNVAFRGKNSSGTSVDLAKINSNNDIRLGHSSLNTIIASSKGELKVSDGSKLYRVFHAGNMGKGSGLDADKMLGIAGENFARRDAINRFARTQYIEDGNLYMEKVPDGATGSLYFRYKGQQVGRVYSTNDGELRLYGGSSLGMKIKSNGWTETTFTHTLNAKNRNVSIRFKLKDSDDGRGLHLNNTSGRFGMWDFKDSGWYFYSEKNSQEVRFPQPIAVQGHKVSISSSTPSKPSNGDIWFKL